MQWIIDHFALILSAILVLSESAAAIVQLLFPDNKGVSGVIAGIIKFLQGIGAKEPGK